jgi:hypothetical protein
MHNVVEISNQLLPSSPPVPQPPTAFPECMDVSQMTYELSITVYLNNKRVSTEFGMQKIGDVSLYDVKRKACVDIERILEMDDDFQFVKVEAEMAHKGLLKGSWSMQDVRTQGGWEGVESCVGSWLSFNKAIGVNNKVIYKRRIQAVLQIPIAVAEPAVAIPVGASASMEQNTYLPHLLGQKRMSTPLSINLLLNLPCTMHI